MVLLGSDIHSPSNVQRDEQNIQHEGHVANIQSQLEETWNESRKLTVDRFAPVELKIPPQHCDKQVTNDDFKLQGRIKFTDHQSKHSY